MNINELKIGDKVKYKSVEGVAKGTIYQLLHDAVVYREKIGEGWKRKIDIICKLDPITTEVIVPGQYKEIPIDHAHNKNICNCCGQIVCKKYAGIYKNYPVPEVKYYCKSCKKHLFSQIGYPEDKYETYCNNCTGLESFKFDYTMSGYDLWIPEHIRVKMGNRINKTYTIEIKEKNKYEI